LLSFLEHDEEKGKDDEVVLAMNYWRGLSSQCRSTITVGDDMVPLAEFLRCRKGFKKYVFHRRFEVICD